MSITIPSPSNPHCQVAWHWRAFAGGRRNRGKDEEDDNRRVTCGCARAPRHLRTSTENVCGGGGGAAGGARWGGSSVGPARLEGLPAAWSPGAATIKVKWPATGGALAQMLTGRWPREVTTVELVSVAASSTMNLYLHKIRFASCWLLEVAIQLRINCRL
ncbi:unnamed protein product [Urochloa humidicola]